MVCPWQTANRSSSLIFSPLTLSRRRPQTKARASFSRTLAVLEKPPADSIGGGGRRGRGRGRRRRRRRWRRVVYIRRRFVRRIFPRQHKAERLRHRPSGTLSSTGVGSLLWKMSSIYVTRRPTVGGSPEARRCSDKK